VIEDFLRGWVFTRRHYLVRNQHLGTISVSHLQDLEVIQEMISGSRSRILRVVRMDDGTHK
jgi:hypothetical protein